MTKEQVYYRGDNAYVTETRAVLGNSTYELADIISVSTHKVKTKTTIGNGAIAFGAVMLTLSLFESTIVFYDPTTTAWRVIVMVLGLIGLVLLIGGIIAVKTARKAWTVRIATAFTESDPLVSHDWESVDHIVKAINMASRRLSPKEEK